MSLSIILTCYNEVPLIFETYRVLSTLMQAAGIEHEFIVVDDGSTEAVQRELKEFFAESSAGLILSPRNEGRGAAVTKGIRAATKAYVGFTDTDLEIPAHALLVLHHTAVALQADMVIADRVYRADLSLRHLVRNLGSAALRRASWLTLGLDHLDSESGAKVFDRSAVGRILDHVSDPRWFWDTEIVAEAIKRSQRVVQVPVVVTRRRDKRSTVRPLRDALTYLRALHAYKKGRRARAAAEGDFGV